MVLVVLRAVFVLLMGALGWFYMSSNAGSVGINAWLMMPVTISLGVFFMCVDILAPRRKLAVFSGTLFGLVVGVMIAFALSFVVKLMIDQIPLTQDFGESKHASLVNFVNIIVGIICCYLSISFILQTRDDFRFIIPYVEISRQQKGPRAIMLDTSALIDGRIVEVCRSGVIDGQIIVPKFVIGELQKVADSADKLKRTRGRRGLDKLAELQALEKLDVQLFEASHLDEVEGGVDQKLVRLAKELNGRVLTTDYNLNKVAHLLGVDVINLNDLADALKPVVLTGDRLSVKIVRSGEEPGQGVGYLEDGTMVVVEGARQRLQEDVELVVSRILQTAAGRMVFGKAIADGPTRRGNATTGTSVPSSG